MNITRTFENDYNQYKRIIFKVVSDIPRIGDIELLAGCYRRTVNDVIRLTNKANPCDEGDNGYYELYKVWYDVEQCQLDIDECGNNIEYYEPDEPECEYIAIWTEYSEEGTK